MTEGKAIIKFSLITAAAFILPILMSGWTWLFLGAWLIPAGQIIWMLKRGYAWLLGVLAVLDSFFGVFWMMMGGVEGGTMFQAAKLMLILTYFSSVGIAIFVDEV